MQSGHSILFYYAIAILDFEYIYIIIIIINLFNPLTTMRHCCPAFVVCCISLVSINFVYIFIERERDNGREK